jgi:hypothetical protein
MYVNSIYLSELEIKVTTSSYLNILFILDADGETYDLILRQKGWFQFLHRQLSFKGHRHSEIGMPFFKKIL